MKDNQNVNELASILKQEETRLKQQGNFLLHFIIQEVRKKSGHYQFDCPSNVWFEQKDKPNAFVCFESNLTEINTW